MRKKAEAEIDILRNEQGESKGLATKDFKARFCKLITDHYLGKIFCFCICSTHLITFVAFIQPTPSLGIKPLCWNKRMKSKID